MPHTPEIPRAFGSAQALTRFFMRLVILSIFAAFSGQGFGKALEGLLAFAVFYCIFSAAIRREKPFGPVLTHFDEAAAFVVIARLVAWTS
jgi:hypothetical protein